MWLSSLFLLAFVASHYPLRGRHVTSMKADRANWLPKPVITATNLYAKPLQATVCMELLPPTHVTEPIRSPLFLNNKHNTSYQLQNLPFVICIHGKRLNYIWSCNGSKKETVLPSLFALSVIASVVFFFSFVTAVGRAVVTMMLCSPVILWAADCLGLI
jgi:hypothetical protein